MSGPLTQDLQTLSQANVDRLHDILIDLTHGAAPIGRTRRFAGLTLDVTRAARTQQFERRLQPRLARAPTDERARGHAATVVVDDPDLQDVAAGLIAVIDLGDGCGVISVRHEHTD